MVRLALQFKCRLENLSELLISPDKSWHLSVICTSCHEQHGKPIVIQLDDEVEVPGSRGTATCVLKCQFCQRHSSCTIERASFHSVIGHEDSGVFKTLVIIDCRGMEIASWIPTDGYTAKGLNTSTTFQDISLDEEYYEYDEEASLPVEITEIETRVTRA